MIILILGVLFGIFFTMFAQQNTGWVSLTLYNATFSLPIYLIIASSLLTGMVIGLLYSIFNQIGAYSNIKNRDAVIKKLKQRNKELALKVAELRNDKVELKDVVKEKKQEIREERIENVNKDTQDLFGRIKRSLSF